MDFEKASRLNLRFESTKGLLSVEDLWNLPLTSARNSNLDDIAKGLNRELKDTREESFVVKATAGDEALQLKFDIVKHIIGVRMAENEEAKLKAEKKEKKQRLMEILGRKQEEELEGKSPEEIQAMIAEL